MALLSVIGFESSKTVQVRIYNVTTTTEVVAWTSTSVVERIEGDGYSTYYYLYALVAGSEYIIDWKDNSTPVKTASEGISVLQSNIDAKLSLTADAILDKVIEGTITFRQALRIFLSVLAGKSTGGGTVNLTFRDNADSKARITATVDANGNRTAMTLDGST